MKNRITLFAILLITVTTFNPLFSQTQVGADIDGEAAEDRSSAVSLSSDGSRVAIGARLNDGNGIDAGHVRVFDWNGNNWIQAGQDIDGEVAGDLSGFSVSLSSDGNRVAIGAELNDGTGVDAGHVRVFDWNGNDWMQVGQDIDGEAAEDKSGGVSLSSDGNRVAIGARFNSGNGFEAGHVRIYELDGGAWTQVGDDIDGEAAGDHSGFSVSLSSDGSRVAIGAQLNDGTGTDAGHVRVFDWNGNDWIQVGEDIDGEAANDQSGICVSLSSDGSRVAIGAWRNDGINGGNSGQVRVYDWDGGAWTKVGQDIDGEALDDQLGFAVSLSSDGSRVAAGAWSNDGESGDITDNRGHVRLYDWDGTDWMQVCNDIDGEAADDFSGRFVSLSSDGIRVAIGAARNGGNGFESGHVRVYECPIPVSTKEPNAKAIIEVYPNPTNGLIQIEGKNSDHTQTRVWSATGKPIEFYGLSGNGQIDISHLPGGLYFLEFRNKDRVVIEKIIKK